MEIEYKRELTKSYMCVKTDQDFLPFEKEILTRSSISGIVPVNTTFADAATVCWYDITGMQAFDHALEMEMMDSQMLTQFLVSLCGTLERLEGFLLDPGHLWFSQESIFKNNRDGSFWFCYCPEGKENITEGFQKLMEYLLTKIDHKDQRAVKMAYHIYDQVIKEGYSLIAIRESLTYDRVDIEPVPDRTLENKQPIVPKEIRNLIYTIRGKQVMLDSDLATLYQMETKNLNKAVKRNIERFPASFCFQLTEKEVENLRFQIGTSSLNYGGRRYLPYVFTEQGVAMASAILRSDIAVKMSVQIMEAFVEMRRMLISNASLFHRLDNIELKQLEADQKFEEIFKALESDKLHSEKGIFYNGQVFDAYAFVSDIIRSAGSSIILLDNYVDDTVLTLLGKRNDNVTATILTKSISNQLRLDLQRYNSQYPAIDIEIFSDAHDRFLIIDNAELYHIGASLKDLGKKWFAFSRMDIEVGRMLQILGRL